MVCCYFYFMKELIQDLRKFLYENVCLNYLNNFRTCPKNASNNL